MTFRHIGLAGGLAMFVAVVFPKPIMLPAFAGVFLLALLLAKPYDRWEKRVLDRHVQKAGAAFEVANQGIRERQQVFSLEEYDRRRTVWEAMSNLFLDTEVDIPYIAWKLEESGYTVDDLDAIWEREAVPEFIGNLFSIAGEWAGIRLNEASLLKRATRRRPMVSAWWWHPVYWALSREWRQVKAIMAHYRAAPEP